MLDGARLMILNYLVSYSQSRDAIVSKSIVALFLPLFVCLFFMLFLKVDHVGPVHDRTFTYSLTVGARNSEDVIVTCGIAKGKKDAKRRCCEAMVLKLSDLPPPPPMPMHFMNNRFGLR